MKTITIGRSSQCDIIVPHNNVSRVHARMSVVGGKYVFEDVSKHGSNVAGQFVNATRITVAPGTEILLAGQVPLNWGQVYSLLPLSGGNSYGAETQVGGPVGPVGHGVQGGYGGQVPAYDESIGAGWAILSFLIPIAGWIMYFVWKDDTPRRASQAAKIAWAGFAFNVLMMAAAR